MQILSDRRGDGRRALSVPGHGGQHFGGRVVDEFAGRHSVSRVGGPRWDHSLKISSLCDCGSPNAECAASRRSSIVLAGMLASGYLVRLRYVQCWAQSISCLFKCRCCVWCRSPSPTRTSTPVRHCRRNGLRMHCVVYVVVCFSIIGADAESFKNPFSGAQLRTSGQKNGPGAIPLRFSKQKQYHLVPL